MSFKMNEPYVEAGSDIYLTFFNYQIGNTISRLSKIRGFFVF